MIIVTRPITIETRWGPRELTHWHFTRFWEKVFIPAEDDPDGELCWEWSGATIGSGRYAGMSLYMPAVGKDFMIPASHIALAAEGIVVPRGRVARHKCPGPYGPNTRCVRPSHLMLGTHAENIRDRIEDERRLAALWDELGRDE